MGSMATQLCRCEREKSLQPADRSRRSEGSATAGYLRGSDIGKGDPAQRLANSPTVQRLAEQEASVNRTGMPDGLKTALESLSGKDLSHLRVHYNSPEPAQLQAHAFAQGPDIHLAPGQRRHLPHEGWHAVQQMEGRVRPTMQLHGESINDNAGLEREADVMGARALRHRGGAEPAAQLGRAAAGHTAQENASPVQRSAETTPESTVVQRYPHPLQGDRQVINSSLLSRLQELRPGATLRDLLLSEDPIVAEVKREYSQQRGDTGEADLTMALSLLAAAELQRSGTDFQRLTGRVTNTNLSKNERRLDDIKMMAYDQKELLLDAYALNPEERLAIEAYTDANKGEEEFPVYETGGDVVGNTPNSRFMGRKAHWRAFGDGWKALDSALLKIPSLGQLGLELTTYRGVREATEIDQLGQLAPGTGVRHGVGTMGMGQKHMMSTALTYNSHWDRGVGLGGIVAMTGTSGRFINPFGVFGALDGGEILYSHGMVSRYAGSNPQGYRVNAGQTAPVYHLQEVTQGEETRGGRQVVEDHQYAAVDADPFEHLWKYALIREIAPEFGANPVNLQAARFATGIHGDLAKLTSRELMNLYTS